MNAHLEGDEAKLLALNREAHSAAEHLAFGATTLGKANYGVTP